MIQYEYEINLQCHQYNTTQIVDLTKQTLLIGFGVKNSHSEQEFPSNCKGLYNWGKFTTAP